MRPNASPSKSETAQILQQMTHAFASTDDRREAIRATERWVKAILGQASQVSLLIPDSAGRMKRVNPRLQIRNGAAASKEVRRIFLDKKSSFSELSPGRNHLMIPLICRGESVGVMEILGSRTPGHVEWDALEAVAAQAAIVFRNQKRAAAAKREREALVKVSGLVDAIGQAATLDSAVRIVLKFCFEELRIPAAGWTVKGGRLALVGVKGLEGQAASRVRKRMATLGFEHARKALMASLFRRVSGKENIRMYDGGSALIAASHPAGHLGSALEAAMNLIREASRRLAAESPARELNPRLELGISWMAHEIRSPLLGAKAAIELSLWQGDGIGDKDLLERSKTELERLADYIEPLLRWGVTTGSLNRTRADLVRIVKEAVDLACRTEADQDRVWVSASRPVVGLADREQLRVAISLVLRNSLRFSPKQDQVAVYVKTVGGLPTVTIRDRGEGVPAEEEESIFDPFMGAGNAPKSRRAKGLALFIVQRVIEAHGGIFSLDNENEGMTFTIQLPELERGGERASSRSRRP